MSQIIVTSRYLKSGKPKTKAKRKNYTKYIATRETVEVREQNNINAQAPASKNQQELLRDLLMDFPEAKRYLEYEDYHANPTVENASELISTIIERHADVIGNRQNFVGYMANRPGAEKRGSHGLFNEKDEPIILEQVANEVANHKGNVWSHIVSLRREDAIRLNYDNSERWRELVMRHINDIAEQTRIPLCNLKWYSAFHDTTHHPHIHLIVYSQNPKQGLLSKEGINKIRSVFANDIFHDDLQSVYQEQTVKRDELKLESKKYVENLLEQISSGSFHNAELEILVQRLRQQLDNATGKKVYGYLPADIKNTVNEIFKQLSMDDNIQSLYEKWCELERQKYKTYTLKEKEFPQLHENKVFNSIRNMIISQVSDMKSVVDSHIIYAPELDDEIILESDFDELQIPNDKKEDKQVIEVPKSKPRTKKKIIDDLVELQNSDKLENIKAKRYLAKEYISGEYLEQNIEKGITMLTECADSGDAFSAYRLAKILITNEQYRDIPRAVDLLKNCADENKFASYLLGKLYLFGAGDIEKDKAEAIKWFILSAEQGNEYAQNLIENIEDYENAMLANTICGLFASLSRCIADDYNQRFNSNRQSVDRKLRRVIHEKKQALGMKEEQGQEQTY